MDAVEVAVVAVVVVPVVVVIWVCVAVSPEVTDVVRQRAFAVVVDLVLGLVDEVDEVLVAYCGVVL